MIASIARHAPSTRDVLAVVALAAAAALGACQPESGGPADGDASAGDAAVDRDAGVVEVVGRDYAFEAPSDVPSGWTTFRLVNEGAEPHFVLLNRLPEGATFEQYVEEVGAAFDSAWHRLRDGAVDRAEAGATLGRLLPDWYASVRQTGGTGLLAPGRSATTTVRLEPGRYVLECYVKTPDGEFHSSLGMVAPLTVTADSSGVRPPDPDVGITLTNDSISVGGEPGPGVQTVEVSFEEQPEAGLGNDVHVVRLEEGTSVDDVVPWMDWMNEGGLRPPAPALFVGGTQEMPAGRTAYFTVELEPGRYAWIAETGASRGLVEEFTVE